MRYLVDWWSMRHTVHLAASHPQWTEPNVTKNIKSAWTFVLKENNKILIFSTPLAGKGLLLQSPSATLLHLCKGEINICLFLSIERRLKPEHVIPSEYTQSGDCRFLAYIPSWWKNQPWLVRGGGWRPTPFQLITFTYKVAVYAPAEWADTRKLFWEANWSWDIFLIWCLKVV